MIQGGRTAVARSTGPVASRPVWTASPLAQSGHFARVAAGAFGWGRKPNPVTVPTTPEPAAPPPPKPATTTAPKPAPSAPTPTPTPAPSPVPPAPAAPQAPATAAAAAPIVATNAAAGAAGGALATKGDTGKVSVRFWLKFRVEYGQSIAIVGGSKALGAWDVSKAPRLSWSDGDLWNVTLDLDAGTVYEYKYVVISHDGHNPAAWQWGANGVIALRWADKKVELFDNWGNGPGALVITDGAEATREQKLLQWVGEFASARAELVRAKTELAAAKEELRVLRAEVGVRRAEAADAESRNKSLEQEITALRAQLDSGRARTRATLAEASRLLDMFEDASTNSKNGKNSQNGNGNGKNGNGKNGVSNGKNGNGKPLEASASQVPTNGSKVAPVALTELSSAAAATAAGSETANGNGGFFDIFSGLNPLGRPAATPDSSPGVTNGVSTPTPDAASAVPKADDSARGGGSRPAPANTNSTAVAAATPSARKASRE